MCDHPEFKASVAVVRLREKDDGPITDYMAEVRVECRMCGQPFGFKGMGQGLSAAYPMMSADHTEARLPIEPVQALHAAH